LFANNYQIKRMFLNETLKKITLGIFAFALLGCAFATEAKANKVIVQGKGSYGVIRGLIIDDRGNPMASALISIARVGTSAVLKQIKSAADGSFITRIIPGTYNLVARADGYDQVAINDVQVGRSAEVYYGLKLERAGNGRTFAERKADHDSPKWKIRAAQNQRSIYQAGEGEDKTVAAVENADNGVVEERVGSLGEDQSEGKLRGQSIVESYGAMTAGGETYLGLNFATAQPLSKNTRLIVSGQTGSKAIAPQRLETTIETKLNEAHQLRFTASAAKNGTFTPAGQKDTKEIGQISFQAFDQWQVREGFILVYGFDYARMIGAGTDSAISPRLGVQYDIDARTRLNASYTASTEERTWQDVIDMEGEPVLFRDTLPVESVAEVNDKPVLNKNRRFEIGIERVLDNSSSIEGAAFFDTFSGRGVGLVGLPMGFLAGDENSPVQTANQTGKADGLRVAYHRRFGKIFSAGAGYSFGRGQKLSAAGLKDPQSLFTNQLFQTFMAQLSADLKSGTKVKAVYRLSPQATIFAIDPFAGRMAIYDPSISVMVVQTLPTWGLPFRAEAVIDARNLLDYTIQAVNEDGTIRLNSTGRCLRGGISVRF
jgi:hypothetical protein